MYCVFTVNGTLTCDGDLFEASTGYLSLGLETSRVSLSTVALRSGLEEATLRLQVIFTVDACSP